MLNGFSIDGKGTKRWYKDGRCHREDGPAVECADGCTWYVRGEYLGDDDDGFWELWDLLTDEQRANPTLLKHLPR